MVGQGRLTGLILILAGLAIGVVAGLWLLSNVASGQLQITGFILGLALVLMALVVPALGTGTFLLIRGREEAREFTEVAKERKILDIVRTQGRVRVSDLALELNLSLDQVKNHIYDLVGKGLFTGYIDWKEGVLYTKEASEMRTNKCPNCGATRELVGKGIVKCEYCGAELFL